MNPINQLDDITSIIASVKPQIQALVDQANVKASEQFSKLNNVQVNTLFNYLDRTFIYSGAGLQRGQKKAKPYYDMFGGLPMHKDSWVITMTTKISDLMSIHVAVNHQASMFAVFVNNFVITVNYIREFIDPKPKTEMSKTVQFSWKFPVTTSELDISNKDIFTAPQEQYDSNYIQEDTMSDEDREMEAHLARIREEEAQELRKRTNAAYGISNGNPDDFI